jgi:hypothetical protein
MRVMRFFKDLRVMIAAIASTLKTAVWAMLLLAATMYMFGIGIAQLVVTKMKELWSDGNEIEEDLQHYWGSLSSCIFSLFMSIVGGVDWESAYRPLTTTGAIAPFLFLSYFLFAYFCVMNVIIGIFCQTAIETYAMDTENVMAAQLHEREHFHKTLKNIFAMWDTKYEGFCTRDEFERNINDPNLAKLLRSMDVDTRDAVTMYRMLDVSGNGNLDTDVFIQGCICLRGAAKAVHLERANLELIRATAHLHDSMEILKDVKPVRGMVEALRENMRQLVWLNDEVRPLKGDVEVLRAEVAKLEDCSPREDSSRDLRASAAVLDQIGPLRSMVEELVMKINRFPAGSREGDALLYYMQVDDWKTNEHREIVEC